MLREWLDEKNHAAFMESRRARRAFALPSVGAVGAGMFDWTRLDRVLRQRPAPDVIVVRDGALVDAPAPARADQVRALMAQGTGVVVRRAQRHDGELAALADAYARTFDSVVQIQLFVTPARTRGFGWHYDCEDVVILQTGGQKTYYMRENTRVTDLNGTSDFAAIRGEVSPIGACTLCAGDVLYLPRGMWHMARADDTSFSISLGMAPRG